MKNIIHKLKNTSILVLACLSSAVVMAEIPVTAQQQLSAMSDSPTTTQSYNALNSAHSELVSKTPQPFWSEKQKKAAEYESKMLKAIKDDPENKKNYANLANLYLSNNKTKKAISAYQDAINHDTNNAKLFAAISIAYLHQSKYSMAKTMAEQAIKLDPEMKHAMKIKEYILAKEEVIAQVEQKSTMPIDSNHKKNIH
ncbi:MAG: tetratricopeptide repeat protein [Pseudomonadota bacterium]